MRPRNLLIFGIAVLAGLIAVFLVLDSSQPYTFQGSLIDPPVAAPPFELADVNGQQVNLEDFAGQVVILFFGYTSCPDVCPVTLSDFSKIHSSLGDQVDEVSFVFVTVDPGRDTPERMKKYLTNFDPGIIGLTGTREELTPVWADYGVYEAKQEQESDGNYLVDHSSRIYVIDPDGNLLLTYLFGTDDKLITEDVRHLVTRQGG
ncbi:MAG: SCO family protein [Anaerolineales bacterium]